jgi:hypothetical protein
MGLFVTNASPTLARGVYAIDTPPPAVVSSTGVDVAVLVGQLPWGPTEKLVYDDVANLLHQFAPAGMNHLGSAYLSIIAKGWPNLGIVRVADPTATAATAALKASSTTICNVTALCTGTPGDSIILTVGPASDGNVAHFNLTASVSSASGTTSETYANVDFSTGNNAPPDVSQSVLLASVVFAANGTPDAGNTTMGTATDGSITSTLYVGTPGTDDKGFALLEADDTISHVFTDDSGNSLRSTVNAGLRAHVDLTTDRVGYICGPSGQSASTAQTDVANYRSIRIVYTDPWVYIADDVTGALHLVPSAPFAASVASQVPPSTSIAWRIDAVSSMLDGIQALEANRSGVRAQNTASGISTLIPRKRGGYTFEAGVNTSLTAGIGNLTRTRVGQYIARSVVESWEPYVEGPNIPAYQQDLINSLDDFLGGLKRNADSVNAAFEPYIIDYGIQSIGASNPRSFVQAGNFNVNAQVEIGANMSRIYLNMQYGETVSVTTQ